MKIKDLVEELQKYPPDYDVVVRLPYGISSIIRAVSGIFKTTDYGNDFLEYELFPVDKTEQRAVCIEPVEEVESIIPTGDPSIN